MRTQPRELPHRPGSGLRVLASCLLLWVPACGTRPDSSGSQPETGGGDSAFPEDTGADTDTHGDTAIDDSGSDDTAVHDTAGDYDLWTSDAGGFVSVSVAEYHRCALDSAGSVTCWGSSLFGKTTVPEGSFTAISVARASSCALDELGTPSCWGCEDDGAEYGFSVNSGQCSAPAEALSAIAASDSFGIGVGRAGGSLAYWSISPFADAYGTTPEALGSMLVAIDARSVGFCAVLSDGSANCWDQTDGPASPEGALGPYDLIKAGGGNVCARNGDFTWDCWTPAGAEDEVMDGEAYVAADVGPHSACGIRSSDGGLVCFGSIATAPTPEGAFVDVSVAELSACAVRNDGFVVCWGDLDRVEEAGSGD